MFGQLGLVFPPNLCYNPWTFAPQDTVSQLRCARCLRGAKGRIELDEVRVRVRLDGDRRSRCVLFRHPHVPHHPVGRRGRHTWPPTRMARRSRSRLLASSRRSTANASTAAVPRWCGRTRPASTSPIGFFYELEVVNAADQVVYAMTVGETPNSGSHTAGHRPRLRHALWMAHSCRSRQRARPVVGVGQLLHSARTRCRRDDSGYSTNNGTVGPPRSIGFNEAYNIIVGDSQRHARQPGTRSIA